MNHLLLSDVDGTLLVDGKVADTDMEAIRRFIAKGGSFGLVTGRDETFCRNLLGAHGIEPDCLVCDNGARVLAGDQVLFELSIPSQEIVSLLPVLHDNADLGMPFVTMPDGNHYFAQRRFGPVLMDRMKDVQAGLVHFADTDLEDMLETVEGVPSLSVYAWKDENCAALLKRLSAALPYVKWQQTSHDYVEGSLSDKAQALTVLLEETAPLRVDYVGDGPNDLPAFFLLRNTWCMESAPEEVKRHAANTCASVAEVVERMERDV